MNLEINGMLGAGVAALIAGLVLIRARFRAASGADKALVFGPVFEAVALAVFAAEHFLAARDLMSIVPAWLPGPLFWTYFVGVAWLAAAISFIAWRCVRWSAALAALLFIIIVVTIDLPNLPAHLGDRLFVTLTVRELAFAGGAMVLAGSVLIRVGRGIVATTLVFYGIQHFLFPLFAPGVPLEKLTPAWVPLPVVLAYLVGFILVKESTTSSTRCYSQRPPCWQASARPTDILRKSQNRNNGVMEWRVLRLPCIHGHGLGILTRQAVLFVTIGADSFRSRPLPEAIGPKLPAGCA